MKTILLLITSAALTAMTVSAPAAEKNEKKDRRNDKEEKGGKKEPVVNFFTFTLEGAKDDTVSDIVRTAVGGLKEVKVVSWEKGEKGIDAKISSTLPRLSRSDIAKVLKDTKSLKEEKDLKISEFKTVRPGKDEKKDDKKEDKKDDKKEDKKDDKKDTRPGDKKADAKDEKDAKDDKNMKPDAK